MIDFVRKRDGYSFVEAVESLAEKNNISLTYTDGSEVEDYTGVSPRRIMKANDEAVQYYRVQWENLPDEHPGKQLLADKHMGRETITRFNVGWAPTPEEKNGKWDSLVTHLLKKHFTLDEIKEAGLANTNDRGETFDRFRGRIMWPIYNTAGGCVGFGGRRISDDKNAGAKYVNTTDTPVYHKSELLYNLHRARKNAATEGTVVVVEGYTDVMALDASHIGTGVAACGTAFGEKHAMVLKRALGDGVGSPNSAQIVFMFDGDEAGVKAALRAEAIGSVFAAETYAVVLPDNQDPCDIYMRQGPDGLQRIIDERKTPLTLFAVDNAIDKYDISTPEGVALALSAAGSILGKTKNVYIRERYREHVGNRLGVPAHMVPLTVTENFRNTSPAGNNASGIDDELDFLDTPQGNPNYMVEEEALLMAIQNPHLAEDWYTQVEPDAYTSPLLRQVHQIVAHTYEQLPGTQLSDYSVWRETLLNQAKTNPDAKVKKEFNRLLVQEPKIVADDDSMLAEHAYSTIAQLLDHDAKRRISDRKRAIANTADEDEHTLILTHILNLETYRKDLAKMLKEAKQNLRANKQL